MYITEKPPRIVCGKCGSHDHERVEHNGARFLRCAHCKHEGQREYISPFSLPKSREAWIKKDPETITF